MLDVVSVHRNVRRRLFSKKIYNDTKKDSVMESFLLYVNSFDFLKWNVCSDAGAFMQCVIIGNKDGFRVRETLN